MGTCEFPIYNFACRSQLFWHWCHGNISAGDHAKHVKNIAQSQTLYSVTEINWGKALSILSQM